MNIQENVSLSGYSTMRLGGQARYLAEAATEPELMELLEWAFNKKVPIILMGGGSNVIWRDEGFDGLVIVNKIVGRTVLSEDDESVTIRAGAGEVWDDVVAWTVDLGLTGIEFLSLIPGSTGAAPVQNIGAYGGELSNTLVEVEAYDKQTGALGGILAEACGFGYRTSRFKTSDKGRFLITGIVLKLLKKNAQPPFYEVLQNYLDEHKVTDFTPKTIRQAVIAIRRTKMPDPAKIANNGSFFTNPIVEQAVFEKLKAEHSDIRAWPTSEGHVKLAAGWLIEQAGFKGFHDPETGMATSEKQALVLINEHARSTKELLAFKKKVVDKVHSMFGITLEQEPELLP